MVTEVSGRTTIELEEANEKEQLQRLEAVLFISGRFLNMQEIISLTDFNPIVIKELLYMLRDKYEKRESAIEIVEKSGLWKMDVRSEYTYIINKLATGSVEFTKAEQETLAIVAYKQPIKQSVIIKIRGNKSYDHLKKFSDLGLIKRKKEGHTNILTLSDEFYDYFGVEESGTPFKENDAHAIYAGEKEAESENSEVVKVETMVEESSDVAESKE